MMHSTDVTGYSVTNNEKTEDKYRWRPSSSLAIQIERKPVSIGYIFINRLLDISFSLVLLILTLPLFLLISLVIMITSPGPILFHQIRLGLNGKTFKCYKFRTMVVNAENLLATSKTLQDQFNNDFKIKNDPRVTPFGAFLRKCSLDEFPQLFNVLKGDMSIVGPRPIVPKELVKYGEYGAKLLTVKPGLGGLWQVSGRSDTTYQERIELDMEYIDKQSVWFNIKLIYLTAIIVLKGKGAY